MSSMVILTLLGRKDFARSEHMGANEYIAVRRGRARSCDTTTAVAQLAAVAR